MEFFKKPLFQLDGFKVTVLVVVLIALAFWAYKKYGK